MKKLLLVVLFILLSIKISSSIFAQITFRGNAPKTVIIGDRFCINYILTTTNEYGKDICLHGIHGLKILFGPTNSEQSSSTTIINGNISTQISLTFTYILIAEKEGEWTIPAATIKVGNNEYKSNKLKVKVLQSDQPATTTSSPINQQQFTYQHQSGSSNNDIFVRMNISKTSVYENEGFLVTFKLYSLGEFEVENIKFPEFEGFIAQEIEFPKNRQIDHVNYQGHNYRTLILKQIILYPQHTGKIPIGHGKYDVIIRIHNNKSQKSHNLFDIDDFFDTYSDVKKKLTSLSSAIDVKPLPPNPESFSGAVGNYKITSSISTTKPKANEPITIKITLLGNGNIKMLKNPKIIFPNCFEVYDPKIDVNTRVSTNGVSGTKTIEYYIVPRYAGNFTIPKIQFVYFDLKTNTYKTLFTNEYQLHVKPGIEEGTTTSDIISNTSKKDINFVGQNICHIKTDNFKYQKGHYFFEIFKCWPYYLISILLFVFIFIIYRKQVTKNDGTVLIRIKKANKIAFKQLKIAQKYLKENQKEKFYNEILKAVWSYLSNKLTIPMSSLTKDNVELELIKYGVNDDLIKKLISILNIAEFAHYATSTKNYVTMNELYQQTIEIINQIELNQEECSCFF